MFTPIIQLYKRKGVREDSRLTSKDYRPKYLRIVRTYHLPPSHAFAH